MARKTADREQLVLRKRYASLLVQYRSLTSRLCGAMEYISYENEMMQNPGLTEIITTRITSLNTDIEARVRLLAHPDYLFTQHETDHMEQSLLWHEARFLSVAEASQLSARPLFRDKDCQVKRREFCNAYLKLNQTLLNRLEAIDLSDGLIPQDCETDNIINVCTASFRGQLIANIQRSREMLAQVTITANAMELGKLAVQVRHALRRYTEQVLDLLVIVPQPTLQSTCQPNRSSLRSRYASSVVRCIQLMGHYATPYPAISCYGRYPALHERLIKRVADINRLTDNFIMKMINASCSINKMHMNEMEHALLLQEAMLLPFVQLEQSLPVLMKLENEPERNKAICIEHLKFSDVLLQWLMALSTNAHLVSEEPNQTEGILESIHSLHVAIEAHASRSADALSTPIFTVSGYDLNIVWRNNLIDIMAQLLEEVVMKLSYAALPASGPSLWEQSFTSDFAFTTHAMANTSVTSHNQTVRMIH